MDTRLSRTKRAYENYAFLVSMTQALLRYRDTSKHFQFKLKTIWAWYWIDILELSMTESIKTDLHALTHSCMADKNTSLRRIRFLSMHTVLHLRREMGRKWRDKHYPVDESLNSVCYRPLDERMSLVYSTNGWAALSERNVTLGWLAYRRCLHWALSVLNTRPGQVRQLSPSFRVASRSRTVSKMDLKLSTC